MNTPWKFDILGRLSMLQLIQNLILCYFRSENIDFLPKNLKLDLFLFKNCPKLMQIFVWNQFFEDFERRGAARISPKDVLNSWDHPWRPPALSLRYHFCVPWTSLRRPVIGTNWCNLLDKLYKLWKVFLLEF